MVNEKRARAVVASCNEPIVVLDSERRVVAASDAAARALGSAKAGRRLDEELADAHPEVLVLFLESAPELPAYQELRSGFTAAVSHELRTPLARLLALLEGAELPGSDLGEVVERARQEVAQAGELIDDVLFLGELETGREIVALGTTQAQPIVDEVIRSLSERANHAEITLEVRVEDQVELPLRPRMLRVVLENLLANAIRYAGRGSTCTVVLDESAGRPQLTVSDDGKGVEPSDLTRLFERFYRGDQARATRGTGLGLAIVKHVVTAAGGDIEATSEPGKGLTVTARFPRA